MFEVESIVSNVGHNFPHNFDVAIGLLLQASNVILVVGMA